MFVPCANPDFTSTVKGVTTAGVIVNPLLPVLLKHDVIQSLVPVSMGVYKAGMDQSATLNVT